MPALSFVTEKELNWSPPLVCPTMRRGAPASRSNEPDTLVIRQAKEPWWSRDIRMHALRRVGSSRPSKVAALLPVRNCATPSRAAGMSFGGTRRPPNVSPMPRLTSSSKLA